MLFAYLLLQFHKLNLPDYLLHCKIVQAQSRVRLVTLIHNLYCLS